jgi:hypothetical protein
MDVSGQLHITATLPLVPIRQKAGWAPELVWKLEKRNISPCKESKGISIRDYVFVG